MCKPPNDTFFSNKIDNIVHIRDNNLVRDRRNDPEEISQRRDQFRSLLNLRNRLQAEKKIADNLSKLAYRVFDLNSGTKIQYISAFEILHKTHEAQLRSEIKYLLLLDDAQLNVLSLEESVTWLNQQATISGERVNMCDEFFGQVMRLTQEALNVCQCPEEIKNAERAMEKIRQEKAIAESEFP